jgi:hypothetical protein
VPLIIGIVNAQPITPINTVAIKMKLQKFRCIADSLCSVLLTLGINAELELFQVLTLPMPIIYLKNQALATG